jgi:hypothetical protein
MRPKCVATERLFEISGDAIADFATLLVAGDTAQRRSRIAITTPMPASNDTAAVPP